uniref:Secreted protein n=1 Tax=Steinernema glaseri TaxID=37863 RepID=A0A1I8ATW0_9BILA
MFRIWFVVFRLPVALMAMSLRNTFWTQPPCWTNLSSPHFASVNTHSKGGKSGHMYSWLSLGCAHRQTKDRTGGLRPCCKYLSTVVKVELVL